MKSALALWSCSVRPIRLCLTRPRWKSCHERSISGDQLEPAEDASTTHVLSWRVRLPCEFSWESDRLVHPQATIETLLIRAFGTAALLLLHIVLSVGPLCRLNPRFLPLLYNRRHLGVTTFVLGLAHGTFAIIQFHALGNVNPMVSVFVSNRRYSSLAEFPFQALGFFALIIFFPMAATSHDFWLRNLTAPSWKRLHMLVYVAYGLLVAHVTLGALQSERSPCSSR